MPPRRINMKAQVVILAGLACAKSATFVAEGVLDANNLTGLTIEDLCDMNPGLSIIKQRNLFHIGEYIGKGNQIIATTTIQEIKTTILNPLVQGPNALLNSLFLLCQHQLKLLMQLVQSI